MSHVATLYPFTWWHLLRALLSLLLTQLYSLHYYHPTRMKRLLLSGSLLALLALSGQLPTAQAATHRALASVTTAAADPYNEYYPKGIASAESYLNIQPDGSLPDPLSRSTDEAYAEQRKAEGLRDQSTTLTEYYYLSGYIDRLSQYVESGGH
jgi:hypothetical protein